MQNSNVFVSQRGSASGHALVLSVYVTCPLALTITTVLVLQQNNHNAEMGATALGHNKAHLIVKMAATLLHSTI